MRYFILVMLSVFVAGSVNAAVLPSSESGNIKVLPGNNSSTKVLPGSTSSNSSVLPAGGGTGSKVLPAPASSTGGGDFFAAPSKLRLTKLAASDTGDNSKATREIGEPFHGGYAGGLGGKSLWWKYESHINGYLVISTAGSNFDTVLGVYIGDSVSELTALASDNNSGPNETSMVLVRVFPNSIYYIAVDGYNGASGKIQLQLAGAPAPEVTTGGPVNDDYADRLPLVGSYAMDYGDNFNSTGELGDFRGVYGDDFTFPTVWWTWTAPSEGRVTIKTAGSDFNTFLSVFNSTDGLYYSNDNVSKTDRTSIVTFSVSPGDVIDIAVIGQFENEGLIVLSVDHQPRLVYPSNEVFDFRRGIQGAAYTYTSSFIGRFLNDAEVGEPIHAGVSVNGSQWWTWTAEASGSVTVSAVAIPATGTTPASLFKPVIGVYRGPRVSFLKTVTSAQDTDLNGAAEVSFSVTKGETYQIAVSGMPTSVDGVFTFRLNYERGAPVIASQPNAVTVNEGDKAVFSVSVTAKTTTPVKYQWQRLRPTGGWTNVTNDATYAGATTSTLTVKTTFAMNGTQFRCVITNSAGTVTSKAAKLTVTQVSPTKAKKKVSPTKAKKKASGKLLGLLGGH